jgi:uncharacterized protein
LMAYQFGISAEGNFVDPHRGEPGQNVLSEVNGEEEAAHRFNLSQEEAARQLTEARHILIQHRDKRTAPFLDDKVITGWNALMISGLIKASQALSRPDYLEKAVRSVEFIRTHLYDAETKKLYRRWRAEERRVVAFQSDYALFIQALLDLRDATGEERWLNWARELADKEEELFYDSKEGGFFMTNFQTDLPLNYKEEQDGVIASGNGISLLSRLRLSSLTKNRRWLNCVQNTLHGMAGSLEKYPLAHLTLLKASRLAELSLDTGS